MVNSPSEDSPTERRERPRAGAEHAPALGATPLNPFGDLVMLQHLCARLAKSMKHVFEGLSRKELRAWAEPLVVQRYADYRIERGTALAAWQGLAIAPGRGRALLVLDGQFVMETLDAFFGGDGDAESTSEFTPAAESFVSRIAQSLVAPLATAWEPVTRLGFEPVREPNVAAAPELGADEPVVVTRFGLAAGHAKPVFVDLLYPVSALKPHGASLTAKVHDTTTEVEPQWRNALTRAAMTVPMQVRSVLAEPVIPLGRLLELKTGDVIPIDFGAEVPVMVANRRLGTGQVGTANGRAAVRLTSLEPLNPEEIR